ncbi:imelysin family protein [Parafilimonas terrae]|uniref:Predicted lipoprotein n=1 Tax=Parafilimonas terrae TaxID=1465490 RepID=A0A1I5X8Q1_9BACT|nr:imelysin family protein [Parafilimonas terrae]SFQ28340.1 Predicted lipoprotein [Parafilimonas terrae]
MKNKLAVIAFAVLVFAGCSKDDNDTTPTDNLAETEAAVAGNFGTNVALATYADLAASATTLNTAVNAFVADKSDANLAASKQAWLNLRAIWETSEGFLFGPVEDNEYDPKMDTWPTDYSEMNTLLADESNALELADIQKLDYSLRGFHPIEYMLWGEKSNKTAAEFTDREIKYLISLSADVEELCNELHTDWTSGYTDKVTSAGNGSSVFSTYYEFFTALNDGMIGICNEVGHSDEDEGKIFVPFIQSDSNKVESPYSENSMVDFKNNIQGAYNVYLGKYKAQGTGLTNIVSSMNKNLDNQIRQKFDNAINAFSTVNGPFELAIFEQRVQLQGLMDAIGEVRDILEEELQPFLLANIKN